MSIAEIYAAVELGLIYGIVALGIYITFRVINFPDLTADGGFATGAAVSAIALKAGYHPLLALAFAALGGGTAGLITGILNITFKITDLLAGILTAFMLYSINLRLMGNIPNIALLDEITLFTHSHPLLVLGLLALSLWGLVTYLMTTEWGLALRSVGQNRLLAGAYGVKIPAVVMVALILSNALIGTAGGLLCQHQSFADISIGIGTVIIGLAAVMIGEKLLPFHSIAIAVFACIIGSVIYRLAIAFALHSDVLGLTSADLNLLTGLLVVGVMLLPRKR